MTSRQDLPDRRSTANESGNIVRVRLMRVFYPVIRPWGCPVVPQVETDKAMLERDGLALRIPGTIVRAATVNEDHGRAIPLFLINECYAVDAGLLDLRSIGYSRRPS